MIRFEVTGETVDDFRVNFANVLGVFLPLLRPVQSPPTQPELPTDEKAEPDAPEKTERRTRKKAEPAEPKQIDIEDAIEEKKEREAPDIETVRAKLKELAAAQGHDPVYTLLNSFGVKNASAIPVEKRAEFVAKIDELIAS